MVTYIVAFAPCVALIGLGMMLNAIYLTVGGILYVVALVMGLGFYYLKR